MQDARLTALTRRENERSRPGKPVGLRSAFVVAILAMTGSALATGVAANSSAGAEKAEAGDAAANRSSATTVETVVKMHPTAVVTGDVVTLADVAEIHGEAAALTADWPILSAPAPGTSGVVELSHVQKMLGQRGANLGYWVFRGSTRCTVNRPAERTRRYDHNGDHADQGRTREQAGAGSASQTPMPSCAVQIDKNTLEGVLHEYIAQSLADLGGMPVIQYPPAVDRYLSLSKPTYDFKVTDRGKRQTLGMVSLLVTITGPNGESQDVNVLTNVSLRKQVVVAARQINRGETVQAGDLTLEEAVFDRTDKIGLGDVAPLVGQRIKRFLRKGEHVQDKDIEPMPLVCRNDDVKVIVRRGNFEIVLSARAQSTGCLGDVVEFKTGLGRRSRETFSAVVTGYRKAEMGTPASQAALASTLRKGDS